MRPTVSLRNLVIAALVIGLALLPVYTALSGDRFMLTLFTRIVIMAMAAVLVVKPQGLFPAGSR